MAEAEIVEIPIADVDAEETPAPPEIVEPAPQAKKRGRPKGSKNKKEETPAVPKPRKKSKLRPRLLSQKKKTLHPSDGEWQRHSRPPPSTSRRTLVRSPPRS